MKKYWIWILVVIFILGFLVRLYRFNNPIADWHSFRQSDTNAVSQIYVRDGINLAYPRFFDISNVPSGKYDNPKGYRFVEFPIYNVAQVGIYKVSSWAGLNLAEAGRVVTILVTLLGAFFVYLLTKKYANQQAGFLAAVFYLFLPYSIYYGRTILPDPAAATAITGGVYFFDGWLARVKGKKLTVTPISWFLAGILFTAVSFLLKPYALFYTLPMLYIAWEKFGSQLFKKWQLWVFAFVAITPLVIWRYWIGMHPEGVPQSAWLLNGNGIRFRPAFFRWILYERITKLIFGYIGLLFLTVGAWSVFKNRKYWIFAAFAISSLIYLTVIATGNVQHDYYQIYIIPTLSMFAGIGVDFLMKLNKNTAWKGLIFVLILATFFVGWFGINKKGLGGGVADYFNINDHGMVEAGEKANQILPKDAVVIALYDGSTTLLNIIARPGWYSFEKDINGLKKMGATHLVIPNPTENDIDGFAQTYPVIASSSSYLIMKLK